MIANRLRLLSLAPGLHQPADLSLAGIIRILKGQGDQLALKSLLPGYLSYKSTVSGRAFKTVA